MKKTVLALTALAAFAAAPAFAGGTHISVGFYSPAPVYYRTAPVVYYPPVQHVYYAPPPVYYYGRHDRGHHHRSHAHNRHGHQTAWNGSGYGVGGGWRH